MSKEKEIAAIAIFAAFTAALGLIPRIELAAGVPITAQSLGVMLAGCVLGARAGFLSILLFIGLVALGLPLLAGGRGGLGVFVGPTAGFIIGYPIAAYVTGFVAEKLKAQSVFWASFFGSIIGAIIVLYLLGIIGLSLVADMSFGAASLAMLPFIPGDLLKAVIAALIASSVFRLRPEWVETR